MTGFLRFVAETATVALLFGLAIYLLPLIGVALGIAK